MHFYDLLSIVIILPLFLVVATTDDWVEYGSPIGLEDNTMPGNIISLSADGKTLAVGKDWSYTDNINGNFNKVRVYRFNGVAWNPVGTPIGAEGTSSGALSLSADGTSVAIGSRYQNESKASQGQTEVYKLSGSEWVKQGSAINGLVEGERSGTAVTISANGSIVAIGAPGHGNDAGIVRTYTFQQGNWLQIGAGIDGVSLDDGAGYAISLSGDGTVLAIGAEFHDQPYSNCGHARVFRFQSTEWLPLGQGIGGTSENAHFGTKVSLSSDGHTVGAAYYQVLGPDQTADEKVRWIVKAAVYTLVHGAWAQVGNALGDMDGNGCSLALSGDGRMLAFGVQGSHRSSEVDVYQHQVDAWKKVGSFSGAHPYQVSGNAVSMSSNGDVVATIVRHDLSTSTIGTSKYVAEVFADLQKTGRDEPEVSGGIRTITPSKAGLVMFLTLSVVTMAAGCC